MMGRVPRRQVGDTDPDRSGLIARAYTSRPTRYVRSAPWTFGWLAILLVTTIVQRSVSPERLRTILGDRSTNIDHLSDDPVRVMISSLFWLDGYFWLPYVLLYCVFNVPAERWLGATRWLAVGLLSHVIATLLSEGLLYWAIEHGRASETLINTEDIGVSYFLAGIVGVLTYRIVYPWRWLYLVAMVALFVSALLSNVTFTGIGHLSAFLLGLACHPLTRGVPTKLWNPTDAVARMRQRVRRR
jgi:hypothetical protein